MVCPRFFVFVFSSVIVLVFVRFACCNFYFYIVFVFQIAIVFVFVTKIALEYTASHYPLAMGTGIICRTESDSKPPSVHGAHTPGLDH